MNFCELPIPKWCVASVFLLVITVSLGLNEFTQLGKEVKKNFKTQISPCLHREIDVEKYFSWIVQENVLCDTNLRSNFELEECYSSNSSHGVGGHYCMIELLSEGNTSNSSQKENIKIALCVPAFCSERDLETHIVNSVRDINEKHVVVKRNSTVCYKTEQKTSLTLYFYVSLFLLSFITLVMVCSIYDLLKNSKFEGKNASSLVKLCKDFSIICNYGKLTDTSLPNEKPCIHLISILSVLLIIIGQQEIFVNTAVSRPLVHQISSSRCVDLLFVISGFLEFHYGFEPMQKGSGLFFFVSVVFRWLRMTPMFCIVALFTMYVLPNLDDGVIWKHQIQSEAKICESSFWSNVFCVKKFSDSNKECLSISWYIRVDIQLSVIGGLLLWALVKKTKSGLIALSVIFACTYVFTAMYSTRRDANLEEVIQFQTSVYSRFPPYFIGFSIGIMLNFLKKSDFRFTNTQKVSILVATYGLKIVIAFCDGLIPVDKVSNWSTLIVVLYAEVSRWFFVLFEASMILIYYTCGLGLLNKIIELKIIIPLGRLSYIVLLTSTVIQLLHTANSEGGKTCTHRVSKLVTWIWVDILCAYLVGFLLHLFFEAPFSRISRKLLKNLLSIFAKPADESYIFSTQDERDNDSEKSMNGKLEQNVGPANGGNIFAIENEAYEEDEEAVQGCRL